MPFGDSVVSAQMVSQHIIYSAYTTPFPALTQCLLQTPMSGSWTPLASPALQNGQLDRPPLACSSPACPAALHATCFTSPLISKCKETLTLSAAVHSRMTKDAVINWLSNKPQL